MERKAARDRGLFVDLAIPALHGGAAGVAFLAVALSSGLPGSVRLDDLVTAQIFPAGAVLLLAAGAVEIGAMIGFVFALLGLGAVSEARPREER